MAFVIMKGKFNFATKTDLSIILRIERNHIHSRRGNERGLPAKMARPDVTIWAVYLIVPRVKKLSLW